MRTVLPVNAIFPGPPGKPSAYFMFDSPAMVHTRSASRAQPGAATTPSVADGKASPTSARVLIAGGSISGLALANMLEQTGVSYLVLEKYDIAPQLGASIALLPNGARILDQIGCWEGVLQMVGRSDAFNCMQLRGPDGSVITSNNEFGQLIERRMGYLPVALERRMLIQVLYDNLRDKSRVRTQKGVIQVRQHPDRVEVVTKDGEVFTSEILVGADGIHSIVRKEMWRLGLERHPKEFSIDEQSASVEFSCIFGMSLMPAGLARDSSVNGQGYDYAYLVMDGPDDTVFWFLFSKNEHKRHGLWETLPRYTDAQKDELAARHFGDKITETLTFGDLYKTQVMSTLQALPEIVFKRWHDGRMIVIGDAAHKFNPIGGQGGSNALEDAAVLTTHLVNMLRSRNDAALSSADIDTVFSSTQAERVPRAHVFNDQSHMLQTINSRGTPLWEFVGTRVVPALGMEGAVHILCGLLRSAPRVGPLPVRTPRSADAWTDELPAKPWSTLIPMQLLSVVAFAGLLFTAAMKLFFAVQLDDPLGLPDSMRFRGAPLQARYTGVPALDMPLRFIVALFSDGISWNDMGHSLQCFYLLMYLTPILLVWYVEASRRGSSSTLISKPSVYGLLMNLSGIGVIGPLYLIANTLRDSSATYVSAGRRAVPVSLAKYILPSIILGYVIPTLLMFTTYLPTDQHQTLVVLWQFAAVFVSLCLAAFARLDAPGSYDQRTLARASSPSRAEKQILPMLPRDRPANNDDAPHLIRAYGTIFLLCAAVHLGVAYMLFTSSSRLLLIKRLIVPTDTAMPTTLPDAAFTILRWDHLFAVLAFWAYGLFSVLCMRGAGVVTTGQGMKAVSAFTLGHAVVGPGAALMGLWIWRERVMRADVKGRG